MSKREDGGPATEAVPWLDRATVSFLPYMTGDGYGWGGEAVLTIGDASIIIGDRSLAEEIAERWNDVGATLEPSHD